MMANDAINIQGFRQQSFAVSAVAAQGNSLDRGNYDVWSDVDVWIKIGKTVDDVTASNGYMLYAGNVVSFFIDQGSRIGAIATGAGTLRFHRVG